MMLNPLLSLLPPNSHNRTSIIIYLLLFGTAISAQADDGSFKRHILGVIVGMTHSDGENNYNFGLEYEYLLSKRFGIGATYERTPEAHDGEGVSVYYAAGFWHLDDHWRLGIGRGEERVHGSHGHTENLTRAAVSYDFHWGELGIAPTLSFDRVDGETTEVFGIAVNKKF